MDCSKLRLLANQMHFHCFGAILIGTVSRRAPLISWHEPPGIGGISEAMWAKLTLAHPTVHVRFNAAAILPTFLPPAAQTVPFGVSRTSAEFDHGHKIYLIYQGLIHNTRLALSSVGQQQDVG
jgi:hypothetical protein